MGGEGGGNVEVWKCRGCGGEGVEVEKVWEVCRCEDLVWEVCRCDGGNL